MLFYRNASSYSNAFVIQRYARTVIDEGTLFAAADTGSDFDAALRYSKWTVSNPARTSGCVELVVSFSGSESPSTAGTRKTCKPLVDYLARNLMPCH